jgi:hypothetical protein
VTSHEGRQPNFFDFIFRVRQDPEIHGVSLAWRRRKSATTSSAGLALVVPGQCLRSKIKRHWRLKAAASGTPVTSTILK